MRKTLGQCEEGLRLNLSEVHSEENTRSDSRFPRKIRVGYWGTGGGVSHLVGGVKTSEVRLDGLLLYACFTDLIVCARERKAVGGQQAVDLETADEDAIGYTSRAHQINLNNRAKVWPPKCLKRRGPWPKRKPLHEDLFAVAIGGGPRKQSSKGEKKRWCCFFNEVLYGMG